MPYRPVVNRSSWIWLPAPLQVERCMRRINVASPFPTIGSSARWPTDDRWKHLSGECIFGAHGRSQRLRHRSVDRNTERCAEWRCNDLECGKLDLGGSGATDQSWRSHVGDFGRNDHAQGKVLERIDALAAEIRSSPTATGVASVLLPGDREWKVRHRQCQEGIALPSDVVAKLQLLAADLNMNTDWLKT